MMYTEVITLVVFLTALESNKHVINDLRSKPYMEIILLEAVLLNPLCASGKYRVI